jgi:hypothetical protein
MTRNEREGVYLGLSRKETPVIARNHEEPSEYYVRALDNAQLLLAKEKPNSALYDYRIWSIKRTKEDLHWEEGLTEEDDNG